MCCKSGFFTLVLHVVSLCGSAEEGEELGTRSDPHPVQELARPWCARGATASPETETACQRFQEFIQWPHRCSLQVQYKRTS